MRLGRKTTLLFNINGPFRVHIVCILNSLFIEILPLILKIRYKPKGQFKRISDDELFQNRRIPSSGMLPRVDLVRTYVSEEFSASIVKVTRIGSLGRMLALTSNRRSVASYGLLSS
jgi:hypothetical protein